MLAENECKHLLPEFLCRVCTPVAPRDLIDRRPARKIIPRYRPRVALDADQDAAPGNNESLPPAQFRRP